MAYQGSAMTRRVPPVSRFPVVPTTSSASFAARVEPSTTRAVSVDEGARTRLIGDISSLLHEPAIPDSARSAGLELIGWLARRMPGEAPHALGVEEATLAKRAARRKAR